MHKSMYTNMSNCWAQNRFQEVEKIRLTQKYTPSVSDRRHLRMEEMINMCPLLSDNVLPFPQDYEFLKKITNML